MDEFRDTATQIQQGVKFDGGLGFAKPCPGEEFHTNVYGGRIEGIGRLLQLHPEIVVDIERAGYPYQHVGEVRADTPIPGFVGIGERTAGYVAPDTHMIEPWFHRPQARFDIAQTFPIGQLSKGHT
jgi:hypothetical protein